MVFLSTTMIFFLLSLLSLQLGVSAETTTEMSGIPIPISICDEIKHRLSPHHHHHYHQDMMISSMAPGEVMEVHAIIKKSMENLACIFVFIQNQTLLVIPKINLNLSQLKQKYYSKGYGGYGSSWPEEMDCCKWFFGLMNPLSIQMLPGVRVLVTTNTTWCGQHRI